MSICHESSGSGGKNRFVASICATAAEQNGSAELPSHSLFIASDAGGISAVAMSVSEKPSS